MLALQLPVPRDQKRLKHPRISVFNTAEEEHEPGAILGAEPGNPMAGIVIADRAGVVVCGRMSVAPRSDVGAGAKVRRADNIRMAGVRFFV